jgi:hypothetical protein
MDQAVTLARWIGSGGRPVTAGQVLRKADVPAAGAALRVDVPARLRTMADVRELHRPWCAAVATRLLQVSDGSVAAGPALEYWPPDDGDLLAGWLAGLRAVCAAESYPQDEDSVRLLALALLTVLGEGGALVAGGLWQSVSEALQVLCERYDKSSWEPLEAAGRYGEPETGKPLAGLVVLLAGFGAVAGDRGRPAITPLGRWAAGHLAAGLAGPADSGWPAAEMIAEAARFGDEEQQYHVARAWLAERGPVQAAREVLAAAEGMSPLRRSVAVRLVDMLGDDALPAWQEAAAARCVGPHARAVLAGWDQGSEPDDADWDWLGVEAAATALEDKGPDEALSRVWESMPGAERYGDPFVNLEGTGDEEAVRVRDAMTVGGTIAYTYDLGACWEHEITLEKTVPRDHSQVYPVCVEFRGDSPVEYWSEEEPEEPEPFGMKKVNRRLAALGRERA